MNNRIEKLRQKLSEKELDALLVSQPENRRYMSGFVGTAGWLLISDKEAVLATDFRYTEQAGLQAPDFRVVQISGEVVKWLPELVLPALEGDLGLRRLGFDSAHITYSGYQDLKKAVEELKLELVPDAGTVELLRAIKEPEELAALERAVALTDRAFVHVTERLRPGMTENAVAWELEKFIRENGGEGLAFDTIVGAGPNGARPHHRASDRPLQKGELIVIDMGAKMDSYCADMTRTICLGEPDRQMKKVYDIVLGAQLTAEEIISAGMTGDQADALARKVIEEAGYRDNFGHGLGHGIGLFVHEYPRLGKESKNVLENGMVFSVEPGIYLTGWGGVRIEDLAVLEDGKLRVITKAPKVMG